MEENEGAVESACRVSGDEAFEEVLEVVGDTRVLKPALLLDLEGFRPKVDCVMNFGCEWERRSELDEK